MAPTVNNGLQQENDKRLVTKKSDLVCRVRYCNNLPDIPFDLKFINYPFPTNRYVTYKPTSLEKNYKYEILTEHDLGIPIDLIDPNAYEQHLPHMSPAPQILHADDEKLLEDDSQAPQAAKKSRHSHVNVSWLRRTEYISTELTRYQPQNNDRIEATVGYSRSKAKHMEEPAYTDRDSQLTAIEATFEAAKEPLMNHYSKPGVTAIEELPIFPDFDLWKYPCAQVIFDSDPAPLGRPVATAMEEMSQAMIRGVMDESGEQFVAYFLPTEDTIKKRKRDVEDEVDYVDEEEYDYVMTREYNWNVKNKASKGYEENYFFIVRKDAVYYNELETRVRLNKRRQKPGSERTNSRLVVTHRPLTGHEHNTHRHREAMLQAIGDEEDFYEEEEEEQLEGNDDEGSDEERKSRSRSRSKSGSRSGSRKSSRSSSKSASRSRSRSASGSRRSGSGSPARRSRSGSSARSGSGSPRKSRSRSASRSTKRSRSRSGSGSPARSASGSPARSGSGSPARSGSGSPARSGSGSPARSKSGSPARSGSGSPARSGSGSPRKSRSRSASRSSAGSGSPAKSGPGSPRKSRSASGSPARSGSGSPRKSRSPSGSPARSGSGSPARSGSGSPNRSGSDSD